MDILVYDGKPIVDIRERQEQDAEFQRLFQEILAGLENLPDYLLIRNIYSNWGRSIGEIETLLKDCISNGHDRTDPSSWGAGTMEDSGMYLQLIGKGYTGQDVIWAKPALSDYDPSPPDFRDFTGITEAVLIIDGRMYNEEFREVYGQKDIQKRIDGLLAILLFDNHAGVSGRDRLHLKVEDVSRLPLAEISKAGYFVKG